MNKSHKKGLGKIQKFQFDYDAKYDDLFVYRKDSKSAGGVEIGSVLLDFGKGGDLVAIEIMDAAEFLASSTQPAPIDMKEVLRKLTDCEVDVRVWRNSILMIKMTLFAENKPAAVWNFSVPKLQERSPVTALAGA
ncbi:DUF2283 domain-containing protein [Candidatus Micrarchaeota archaeon]|nr:DUF2283 domain-containing protein [Candidatus Micrarchaeota archaeon]